MSSTRHARAQLLGILAFVAAIGCESAVVGPIYDEGDRAAAMLTIHPNGQAAKPERTVIPGEPFTVPAGVFCEFGIAGEPDENARRAVTVFSDGRTQVIGHGEPTLTNLESGTSAVIKSRYKFTDTFKPDSNELVTNFSGRSFVALLPGDQGPFGEVGENGGLFRFVGHFTATLDLDTDIVTSFTWSGHIEDLCAVLSN